MRSYPSSPAYELLLQSVCFFFSFLINELSMYISHLVLEDSLFFLLVFPFFFPFLGHTNISMLPLQLYLIYLFHLVIGTPYIHT